MKRYCWLFLMLILVFGLAACKMDNSNIRSNVKFKAIDLSPEAASEDEAKTDLAEASEQSEKSDKNRTKTESETTDGTQAEAEQSKSELSDAEVEPPTTESNSITDNEANQASAEDLATDAQAADSNLLGHNTEQDLEQFAAEKEQKMNKDVFEIKENLFLTQITDIYLNFEEYQDKTVKIEGLYGVFSSYEDENEQVPVVFRYGPGCCGNDGWGGFLLDYDGEKPQENDWIEVIGRLEMVKQGIYTDIYIKPESLIIKQERGEELVYN